MPDTVASILVVEDEPLLAGLLERLFGSDYSCVTAATVAEAFSLLKARSFQLVLLDEVLPDGSGLALLQFIKASSPDTGVILMSGNTDEQSVERAKQKRADEFIAKPFDLMHVRSVVERTMASKEAAA
jgi:DNA-binding NtrC family response regulator